MEIERRYWKKKSVDWAIVTEHEISIQKAKNIEWLHTSAKIPPDLHHELYEHTVFEYIGLYPINLVAALIDKKFNLQPGSGMLIVKNMLWHKSIEIDMNQILFVS